MTTAPVFLWERVVDAMAPPTHVFLTQHERLAAISSILRLSSASKALLLCVRGMAARHSLGKQWQLADICTNNSGAVVIDPLSCFAHATLWKAVHLADVDHILQNGIAEATWNIAVDGMGPVLEQAAHWDVPGRGLVVCKASLASSVVHGLLPQHQQEVYDMHYHTRVVRQHEEMKETCGLWEVLLHLPKRPHQAIIVELGSEQHASLVRPFATVEWGRPGPLWSQCSYRHAARTRVPHVPSKYIAELYRNAKKRRAKDELRIA